MEMKPIAATGPAKLYAIILKLRPLQRGTLMPFSGELVHGAWLRWLKNSAPDVAAWLHDGNKRRLFTCSSLQFPVTAQRLQEAERDNIHLPVDPARSCTIRITLLLGELFPVFYETLARFHTVEPGTMRPPFMQIGKQLFLLEEVLIGDDDPSDWSGFIPLDMLVERLRNARLGRNTVVKMEFASLTTFNRSSTKNRGYGAHYARLPLPHYIFPSLLRRWEDVAPPEIVEWVQRERIERYIQEDGVIIADYELTPHHVHFTTHIQPGFIGNCTYHLRGPDEAPTPESPLTVRQQLLLLAHLAYYCGTGYKTSMGMGRTRIFID